MEGWQLGHSPQLHPAGWIPEGGLLHTRVLGGLAQKHPEEQVFKEA